MPLTVFTTVEAKCWPPTTTSGSPGVIQTGSDSGQSGIKTMLGGANGDSSGRGAYKLKGRVTFHWSHLYDWEAVPLAAHLQCNSHYLR